MSHAAPSQGMPRSITVGNLARTDPLMAYASVMASSLLLQAVRQPSGQRLSWIRTEMNKAKLGMGDDVVSKYRELKRRGKATNQALFDALRLTIANRLAAFFDKRISRSAAGLGSTESDIRLGFCTTYALLAAGGGTTVALVSDPAAAAAVTESARVAAEIQGCSREQIEAQIRLAQENNRGTELLLASGGAAAEEEGMGTGAMIAIAGGGVLLLGLLGYAVLKK